MMNNKPFSAASSRPPKSGTDPDFRRVKIGVCPRFWGAVVLCATLAPALAGAATKAAPAAAPEPLNVFKPEEPRKDEKAAPKSVPTAAAAATAAPAAATPPAEAATHALSAAPAPTAPPPAAAPPADKPVALPPPASPAPSAVPPAKTSQPDAVADALRGLKLTDVLIALFTLFVAIFAWRLSAATRRAASTAQSHADANRRAIEASERAAEAAKRSAEAAEKSAQVLQDTAARQLRPYVTVKEFLQGPVKDEKSFLHGWVFQVVWQNSGATPTRGFRYWAALRQFDHEIPGDFDFAPPVMADFAGGELGSHSTVTSGTLFVAQADVLHLQTGTRKAVLYGKAEYNDVLGTDAKRETRFAVEVIIVADPSGANGTPFSFSYFPRHNAIS
ncbi:MAG: hypothetical protein JWO70_2242 [Betaproteobacteria bacterium]|nr:hypothetical protein [Betaproteobacteria bacterium]